MPDKDRSAGLATEDVMPISRAHAIRGMLAATVAIALLQVSGCSGLKTYPVKGKVVFEKGDLNRLAGSAVEFVKDNDPNVRASGEIQADGSFSMATLAGGRPKPGAVEGTHLARIYLTGEEEPQVLFRKAGIDPRFLNFKTSGLIVKVPAEGDVTLKVTPAKPGTKWVNPDDDPGPVGDCR